MMSEEHTWNILEDHFKRKGFVHHQTESYDQFINVGIHKIITEEPEICITTTKGGKCTGSYSCYKVSFSNVYVPNPTVTEDTRVLRSFYPSEARQRDLTYDSPIYATVTEMLEIEGKEPEITEHVRVVLGRIPIMLRSSKCYLSHMTPDERIAAGECEHDQGGYFIVKGKERVLISQLRGVYNIPLVIEQRPGDKYSFCCDMRSMSEETGHSVLVSAMIGTDDRTLCFSLPYIKDPIPMGVVFKAMEYTSDQFADLIGTPKGAQKYIRLISNDSFFVDEQGDGFDLFTSTTSPLLPKILKVDETTAEGKKKIQSHLKEMWKTENHAKWKTMSTRNNALRFIGQRTNHPIKEAERRDYAEQVVDCEIFPHMGVTSSTRDKAYLLGHMVNKLLSTSMGLRKADDRDNYVNKRVESPGVLCHELFRQLFKKYVGTIVATIEKKKQLPDVMSIIPRLTDITKGFNHCFGTGNWGVPKNSYVRAGVAQILSRLSYGATLSNLRRVSIPVGKESKNAAIRQINPSQIMYICPVETPEGAPVGIVLNLSLLTRISDRTPSVLVKEVIELCEYMSPIQECEKVRSKVFLNGILLGGTETPNDLVQEIKDLRRVKMLPWDVSISYEKVDNEVHICADEGRLLRPVFKVDGEKILAQEKDGVSWDELVEKGFIEYIDNMEANGSVIAFHQKELVKCKSDYCEISSAMMLGVMASIIPFPDHSQSPRNCYQCLDPETLVVMADNTKKAIKDIQIGDSVVSVDPVTCVQSITKVINQYVRETDKEIITIETESGRKITCTVDHPVLTMDGWKHAIDAENICVIPQQVVYSGGDADLYITLPETSVKEKHINDLTSIGLYPIKSTSLPILARIVGYLITNGSTGLYDKRPQVQFNFYSIEDCEDFLKDLHELGFSANKVTDVNKIIDVIFEKYGTCKQIIYNNAFASLLIGLVDGYVGKRTTQSYPRIMNWIKNGSMLVKREFLAGFQGGDKLTGVTSTKFVFNHISLPSRVDYVNSLVEFMTEIKVLFEEFDIECSGPFLIKKSQHSQSDDVHLYFKSTPDNHINYFEKIGWRYNIFKYVESIRVYEYQKTCQNRIPNSFESWKRQVKDRAIFVKIVSKTRSVRGNMIADITTESENHSFIAGDSFCVHNSSMGKQAMSMFALSHLTRADTVVHVLNTPQRPLVGTKAADMMGFNDMPSGVNCIVAIACYTGFNQEDSVMLNYSAVQRGLFWATTYKTHSDEEKKQGYNAERICLPPLDKRKHDANYGLLDDNGIVRLRHPKWVDEKGKTKGGGALFVQKGDVIIGKVSIQSDKSGNEVLSDCSIIIGKGEEGYIDRIFSTITPNGYRLVKVVIRSLRIPEVGDKFASRAAQKGTVGMVYRQEDMPFTREGIVPDIIINPHCIPSRMTINQLIESVMGKSCTINGKYGDATPFTRESKNIAEEACKTLGMLGYESTGKEVLMNGMTGENMGMFFIGPVYYQRLKHLVSDKMHARATGPVTTLTRQPLEGRSRDGGQRFGEMERDCLCSVPIPLNCGLSVKIETMENKDYSVLSYHEEKQQVIPSKQSNFLYKGERECVDVVFQDGRTIRGTDNHKILTSENTWIPISEVVKGVTQIKTSITNPLIHVKEEIEKSVNWKFQAGNTNLEITDEESYFRSLSFARLVGYICADGGIYYINRTKMYTGVINLGHKIDLTSALDDLEKFSIIKQQVFTSKKYYSIRIPQNFVEDLMTVKGMIIGTKVNQPATLPNFITDPSCPLPIVREFLGGLFGADGHTCVLALHRGKRDLLTSVSFSKSRIGSHLDSLEKMMEQLQTLLDRFDIHNVTIQKAKETTSSKKKVDSLQENKSYQLTLHLCIDELPRFHEKIGFRYCCHKSQRLEAGASYKRLRDGVTRQHNWLVDRVDEITQFSKIKKEFPNKIVHTKKAIEKAVKELTEKEALLHEYAIPSTHDITDHLVKGTKFGNFRGKGFPNAEEYLKDIGALDWFLQDEPDKTEETDDSPPYEEDTLLECLTNLSVSYGVNRKCEGLPTMNLRVIDIRPAGVHPVYDIQVDDTHTFLANGIVAHNCMIGHGVSKFLQERLFLVSDKYQVSICSKCGNFATSKTECRACDTDQVVPVKLPYVGKLVLQELNAMMLKTKITAK